MAAALKFLVKIFLIFGLLFGLLMQLPIFFFYGEPELKLFALMVFFLEV